jgi:hypothetical protein
MRPRRERTASEGCWADPAYRTVQIAGRDTIFQVSKGRH